MRHGDKVYYHRRHHVKQSATWLYWITRSDRRLAMIKVKDSHRHIDVALECGDDDLVIRLYSVEVATNILKNESDVADLMTKSF